MATEEEGLLDEPLSDEDGSLDDDCDELLSLDDDSLLDDSLELLLEELLLLDEEELEDDELEELELDEDEELLDELDDDDELGSWQHPSPSCTTSHFSLSAIHLAQPNVPAGTLSDLSQPHSPLEEASALQRSGQTTPSES